MIWTQRVTSLDLPVQALARSENTGSLLLYYKRKVSTATQSTASGTIKTECVENRPQFLSGLRSFVHQIHSSFISVIRCGLIAVTT